MIAAVGGCAQSTNAPLARPDQVVSRVTPTGTTTIATTPSHGSSATRPVDGAPRLSTLYRQNGALRDTPPPSGAPTRTDAPMGSRAVPGPGAYAVRRAGAEAAVPPPPVVAAAPRPSSSGEPPHLARATASAEAAGYGGLGVRGTGMGGGGASLGTIGTIGHGRGAAGHASTGSVSSAGAVDDRVAAHGDGVRAEGDVRGPAEAPAAAAPSSVHVTVTVAPGTPTVPAAQRPPADEELDQQQADAFASRLTAATVGDADRRANYLGFLERHGTEAESLGLDMSRRVQFKVLDASGHPVDDARVTLSANGLNLTARTHADGSWDFYPSVTARDFHGELRVEARVGESSATQQVIVPAHGDVNEPVVLRIPANVQPPAPALDLAFVVDVTGSMGDELAYLNTEVGSIVRRIEREEPGVHVRVSATFYRDRVDAQLVQQIPFTTDVAGFAQAMRAVSAGGGGDYPEDMNSGLDAAMNRLAWTEGAAVRTLVLVADAPPQRYGDEQYTFRETMNDAMLHGIRIVPVAASGADRTVEYLFRAMGAFTGAPYVYLTDDSGIGGHHMEADTDRVAIERFNDLLTRLVVSDLHGLGMHEPGALGPHT